MHNMNQPQQNNLTPEMQALISRAVKGTDMEKQCIEHGFIEPQHVIDYRTALSMFKTTDRELQQVVEHAKILNKREECVLVCGETGTGKELLAKILHGERQGEFVGVNCCAVTDTLFESELFGHKKGSFTGADRDRDGLIRQAQRGTLFLDEIGDMPYHLQSKLLRMIQTRKYRRVGSNFDEAVECRIIAATHCDLKTLMREQKFRLDLYQRLSPFVLRLKPLRERGQDEVRLFAGDEMMHQHETNISNARFSGNVRQLLSLKLRGEVLGWETLKGEDFE
jgi:transcriptional regulator with PAS, ATPase and Fis domain